MQPTTVNIEISSTSLNPANLMFLKFKFKFHRDTISLLQSLLRFQTDPFLEGQSDRIDNHAHTGTSISTISNAG
ncbi:MAG: hypothetical protein ACR2NK_04575 [Mariniblastus sp.]